ncbi:DNA polymerase epsilon catalytic subunit A [Tasmannia lanceolata]|uniref:DNA polymerase epsilon catalytic subunit A n=1 Tax=Tasmannia lanceolata TaxID=3420 RepID=UPI0040634532
MGSLMAGWDSHVSDPKAVKYERNRSFTKEEIDAYWKSKKRVEEEHVSAISELLQNSQTEEETGPGSQESLNTGSRTELQRSSSLPLTDRRGNFVTSDSKTDLEKLRKANDWWTGSKWAFLNEPPVTAMEGPSYKYASQYHVAAFCHSKPENSAGISTLKML